jgi:hypothetical protein
MIERRPRSLRPGGTGMERGAGALRAFLSSSHPVRWWAVSMPTDSQTGARAVRLPGDCEGSCAMGDMDVLSYAPTISMTSSSRIRTQIVDDLFRVIVLVDATRLEKVSALQLADYIAMVSLAQIDPEADTRDYASILNVFEEPDFAASLTDWDMAYLSGLYRSQRTLSLAGANRSEVSAAIRRAHLDLRGSED